MRAESGSIPGVALPLPAFAPGSKNKTPARAQVEELDENLETSGDVMTNGTSRQVVWSPDRENIGNFLQVLISNLLILTYS